MWMVQRFTCKHSILSFYILKPNYRMGSMYGNLLGEPAKSGACLIFVAYSVLLCTLDRAERVNGNKHCCQS